MAKIRFTDDEVRKALDIRRLLSVEKEEWVFDSETKGFVVRFTKSGKALAYAQYWVGGKGGRPRKLSLGEIGKVEDGKLTVAAARKLAVAAKGKVADGGDPWAAKKFQRDKLTAETVADAWRLFTASWSDDDRYRRETKALVVNDVLPTLGNVPLVSLNRAELAGVRDKVMLRSQARGRALHAALRAFCNWTVDRGLLEHSPMERMKPLKPLKARRRYLSEMEIAAYWRATGKLGFPWQPIFRLLMLTACRREEVAGMEWRELRDDVWSIPADKTKNGEEHIIDLPPSALEVLALVPEVHGLVFSTTGKTPPSGWSKAKTQLDALMCEDISEFKPFRLHDLRRTVKTTLQERFGTTPHVTEAMLNHMKKGIEAVYDRATYRVERREALLKWSEYVLSIGKSSV